VTAKGVESDNPGRRLWFDVLDELLYREATPLRDARPALDAMVHGDKHVFAQRAQVLNRPFDRVLHQTPHPQPELLEIAGGQLQPVFALGHFAVGPEVR